MTCSTLVLVLSMVVGGLGARKRRVIQQHDVSLASLPECLEQGTYHFEYIDNATKEKMSRGQCKPSSSPGAFYTKENTTVWQCWSKDTPADVRNDAGAKTQNFEGACTFAAYSSSTTPAAIETCDNVLDHNPLDCGPGPSKYWGACYGADKSEKWLCIDKGDNLEGYAKGDCKEHAVRETSKGDFYQNVCRFNPEKNAVYKCDTVKTFDKAEAATCGNKDADPWKSACFSLKEGVSWQCHAKDDEIQTPCSWTDSTNGFFDGECLFEGSEGYDEACTAAGDKLIACEGTTTKPSTAAPSTTKETTPQSEEPDKTRTTTPPGGKSGSSSLRFDLLILFLVNLVIASLAF